MSKLCDQQNVPFNPFMTEAVIYLYDNGLRHERVKILKESVNITIGKYAPLKKRYVRANQSPFMNKKLSKEIMKRSRLRNKFLNTKGDIDKKAYNKYRNYVFCLLRNEKTNFYSNLDTRLQLIIEHFGKLSDHFCLKT